MSQTQTETKVHAQEGGSYTGITTATTTGTASYTMASSLQSGTAVHNEARAKSSAPHRRQTPVDPLSESVTIEESAAFPLPHFESQPEDWPSHLRGMPEYRSIDRNLDHSERPLGANNVEYGFLIFMLGGVLVQNYANLAWRSTFGKVNDKVFRFKIGGNW